jgi:hypothetical protein
MKSHQHLDGLARLVPPTSDLVFFPHCQHRSIQHHGCLRDRTLERCPFAVSCDESSHQRRDLHNEGLLLRCQCISSLLQVGLWQQAVAWFQTHCRPLVMPFQLRHHCVDQESSVPARSSCRDPQYTLQTRCRSLTLRATCGSLFLMLSTRRNGITLNQICSISSPCRGSSNQGKCAMRIKSSTARSFALESLAGCQCISSFVMQDCYEFAQAFGGRLPFLAVAFVRSSAFG